MDDSFALFWENSSLNERTAQGFAAKLNEYGREEHTPRIRFTYSTKDFDFGRQPIDPLQFTFLHRISERTFGDKPLSERELGFVLSALSSRKDGKRYYASAGGTYPLEIFCIVLNGKGALQNSILHYDPITHSAANIGPLAPWPQISGLFSFMGTPPAAIIIFTIVPERIEEKYGARGLRFAFIEVGEALQLVSLRAAQEKLKGYALGGLHENAIRKLLKLDDQVLIALGYAFGK